MPESTTLGWGLDVVQPPSPDLVTGHAIRQMEAAAHHLWPDAPVRLGRIIPSVTSHVQQVDVNGLPWIAKYSVLGSSLVSLLGGSCGDWPTVQRAQARYVAAPDTLVHREAAQLQALADAGLPVPAVRVAHGVLFTEPVPGVTLADRITADPARTAEILAAVTTAVAGPLRDERVTALVDRLPIPERSISRTFLRKFNGVSGPRYLAQAPHGAVLDAVVSRLRRASAGPALLDRPVVYGDLKPEHVIWPDHGGGPLFIDPGLMRSQPCADLAKVASRLVLGLVTAHAPAEHSRTVLDGITDHVLAQAAAQPGRDRTTWLYQTTTLWLMDTTNILTTCLSAPAGLPLPLHGTALVARASTVVRMLNKASGHLLEADSPVSAWRACVDQAAQAAAA
ncbi:phosphotransferase [Streptomyces fradiae]|uniref:phosphotransferase n=1 Tax=Streptomyces fradiae TaxID=1906 RepID=UPI0036CAD758